MESSRLEGEAEKALWMLKTDAERHAQDRASADHMAQWVRVVKAQCMEKSTASSMAAAEAEATRHPDYIQALEDLKTANAIHYKNQFKREAADAFIRAWQTLCSNERANVR